MLWNVLLQLCPRNLAFFERKNKFWATHGGWYMQQACINFLNVLGGHRNLQSPSPSHPQVNQDKFPQHTCASSWFVYLSHCESVLQKIVDEFTWSFWEDKPRENIPLLSFTCSCTWKLQSNRWVSVSKGIFEVEVCTISTRPQTSWEYWALSDAGGTAAAAPPPSGLATLPSVGAVP